MSNINGNGKEGVYDVLVVGAGPGGLAAGMYAARAKLKSLILEKELVGGQLNKTAWIEDYPGFLSIGAQELSQKMEEHAKHFGAEIKATGVSSIKKVGDLFEVTTTEGVLQSKTVILASGGSPNYLGVKGEMEFQKRGVSYCAICDGPLPLFRNKPMVVVGGGDSALEEGGFLTKYASKVYLVHRRDAFRGSQILQDHVKANPKIEVHLDSVLEEIGGGESVEWAKIKHLKTGKILDVQVGAVFIFAGFTPNSGILKEDVQKDKSGHIVTDQFMQSSLSGLFAVGDVRAQLTKQVTNSVGDGTTAAVAAGKYLEGALPEPIGLETLRVSK